MKTKNKNEKQTSKKNPKFLNAEIQHSNELIDYEELEKRGGITGDKNNYCTFHLKEYHRGELHYHHAKNLIDVAAYIANKEELYIEVHHSFRLMKISSIIGILRRLNKEVREEVEKERKAEKEYKNKYKYKKYRK